MNRNRNGCECCWKRDPYRTYIDCPNCKKTLCMKCTSVHPEPNLCGKAMFTCNHGHGINLFQGHVKQFEFKPFREQEGIDG